MGLRLLGVALICLGLALVRWRERLGGVWARSRARELDRAQLLNADLADRLRGGLLDETGLRVAQIQICAFAAFLIASGLALVTGLAR